MKYLKILTLLMIVGLLHSCTDDFEEMNIDPVAPQYVQEDLQFHASLLRPYGGWELQVGKNLFSNLYCQYHANTKADFPSGRYTYGQHWLIVPWNTFFLHINPQFEYIKNYVGDDPTRQNKVEVARIWRAFQCLFATDTYGDMPYFGTGTGETNLPYNTQKEIYYDLFEQLKSSITILNGLEDQTTYGSYDAIYGDDYKMWAKFANSIILRMAIRISDIDPDKARLEGEAALTRDLISSNDENAAHDGDRNSITGGHYLRGISAWNEYRASSTFVEILKNTSEIYDPRMKAFWIAPMERNEDGSFKEIAGVDNGLPADEIGDIYNKTSNLGPAIVRDRDYTLMNYSEVCFLKAEAALLGWAGAGNAGENYVEGVKASFAYWRDQIKNHTDDDKITHSVQWANDGEALTTQLHELQNLDSLGMDNLYLTAGAAWNDGDTEEEKLRKIITQKYIANYPDGQESWSEFRRTGYPYEIKPIIAPDPGTVPKGQFIKKLTYPDQEYNYNTENVENPAINNNQGDGRTVNIWWDVD